MKALWILLALGSLAACGVLGFLVATRKPGPPQKTGAPVRRFVDEIAEMEKVDPKLIIASEAGRYKTMLKELRGVAVGPEDRIYVTGDKTVLVLAPDGSRISSFDLDKPAYSLAVDADGTVYLGMRDHVEVYDAKGVRKAEWANLGPDSWITSVAVAGDRILIGDFGNKTVLRCDKSGKELGRIVPSGADVIKGRFVIPSPFFDVAADVRGEVWVTHTGRRTLEQYRENGSVAAVWGKSGTEIEKFSGCCNPTHIAIRSNGSFVTSEKGLVRIKIHSASGELLGVVAAAKDFPPGITGLDLAVDSKDRILVLDPASSAIRVYIVKI